MIFAVVGITVVSVVAVNLVSLLTKKTQAAETTTLTSINADGNVFQAGEADSVTELPSRRGSFNYYSYASGYNTQNQYKFGDKIYYFGNYSNTNGNPGSQQLYSYDPATDKFTKLANYSTAVEGYYSMKAVYNGTIIYLANQGNFQKYEIAADTWTNLTTLPVTAGTYAQLTYTNNGIYYTAGASAAFYYYDIALNSWTQKLDIPISLSSGTDPVWDGSDYIYAAQRQNTGIYRYTISTNEWTTLSAISGKTIRDGIFQGPAGYFYVATTDSTPYIYQYQVSGDSWSEVTNARTRATEAGDRNVKLMYDGTNIYSFVVNNSGTNKWRRYNVSEQGNYDLPNPATEVRALAAENGVVYAYGDTSKQYKYTLATNSWTELAYLPGANYFGSGALYQGDGKIWSLLRQGASSYENPNWMNYDISTGINNTFSVFDPSVGYNGPIFSLFDVGQSDYIYTFCSTDNSKLRKYQISTNTSTVLATPPGDGIGYVSVVQNAYDGDNYMYFLSQRWDKKFYRYNISANSWDTMADAPLNLDDYNNDSSNVIFDRINGKIYVFAGINTKKLYRYNVATNDWTTLTDATSILGSGSKAVWDRGDYIYVTKGGTSNVFYRYSILGNSWSDMESIPSAIGAGAAALYEGNNIYLAKGTDTKSFYKYNIALNAWADLTSFPGKVGSGSRIINTGDGNLVVYAAGGYPGIYKYNIGGNNKQRNSGISYTASTGNDLTSFNVVGGDTKNRGYINFDTSSIPNNAIVSDVKVKLNVTKAYGAGDTIKIVSNTEIDDTNYPNDNTGNNALHTDLAAATELVSASADFQSTGAKTIDLGATGDAQLQANLTADQFSLGFVGSDETTDWAVFSSNEFLKSSLRPQLEITYTTDPNVPNNPTVINGYTDSGKASALTSDNWSNAAHPYFEFSGASDADSGLAGYYVYFGTTADANPVTAGVYQAHSGAQDAVQSYTAAATLTSGQTYYLRIVARDLSHNNAIDAWSAFTFKADYDNPSQIEYVNASPQGCSTSSLFTLTWPVSADALSGIAGYDYKNGSTGTITDAGNVLSKEIAPYQEGDNIIYFRSKDNAGNSSSWQTAVYCSTGLAYINDGPAVTAGPSSITVTWVSSKATTSYVQVYEGNTYISEQGQTSYSISHSVKVVGLEPEKAYRYRLVWSDVSGNLGESAWYNTVTAITPRILDLKSEIVSPSKVIISWRTNYQSTAILKYGIGDYGNSVPIDGAADNFVRQIESLQGGTDYVVGIDASTTDGSKYSAGVSFSTPPLPIVSALRFEPVADSAQPAVNASWSTNVETTSTIYFGPKGEARKEISQSDKTKDHKIKLDNLSDSTTYEAYVSGIDQWGNTARSDVNTFVTSLDTRPPGITNIIIETSNVGLNKEDTAQAAVSYKTDEPAKCSVEYAKGISGDIYDNKTADDEALIENHINIVSNLVPSSPYHLRITCFDKSNNRTVSASQTITSGEVQESIFSIILKTLNNLFGWLKIL